ncbi:zinc finger protein 112-like [Mercenaria mercenaria]|uniref:zinc finger protein 112-like n=1 Tax=Mercenaria mercenaria TaxID=6596 RepID=UPI00234F35A3|nr:zinc finger protein 112-like [Mercenaria mercenaria]XP_045169859.2 zinc finger protein 112-like [Mercenaria mercenaria]
MEAISENQSDSIENLDTTADCNHPKEAVSYPFICGICSEKFDNLRTFLRHFRCHSTLSRNSFNVCSCLYEDDTNLEINRKNESFECRICKSKFSSICSIHSHVLNCSADGSYIFDNTKKMVYPLSLHCSYFESRENDTGDSIEEDYDNLTEKETVDDKSDGSVSDMMSRAEKVDHILRTVCKLYEKSKTEENVNGRNIDGKKAEKKRGRPKKHHITNGIPEAANVETEKKKRRKSAVKDGKEIEEERTKNQEIKDHIVVKVEVEESNVCKENSDNNKSGNFNNMCNISGTHNDAKDDDDDGGDDDNDLTDEYTPDEKDLGNKPERYKKGFEKKISLRLAQLAKELNNHDLKERRKKSKSSTNKSLQPKRSCLQKAEEECPHCGKFLKPYKLKVHLISHMEDRPFQCDLCPKSYKYQGHLESHKASHQEVKPFYCEMCGKGYVTITLLKHHSMMHHSDSKPCVCSICGASFITNYKLKRHMTKHTGEKSVQCDLCGMGFSTRYNLSVHIQGVHKRENRFACQQCGKQFMTNYQLKVHTMKHSGERPYKCALCRAEYIERKELRRHLKKVHNLPLEESTNALSELLEGYDATKAASTKVGHQISSFTGQVYNQIFEQAEATTASDYISAGSENAFTYTTGDECSSSPYYPVIKNTSVKVLPARDYQMGYPNTHDYHYDNSAEDLAVPLTVQEIHDNSRYHTSINEHCAAKDLSKHRDEKANLNGTTQHDMGANKHLAKHGKEGTVGSCEKIDPNFTVL